MNEEHTAPPPVGSGRESWEAYIRTRLRSVGDDYKELEAVCDVLSERCAAAEEERDRLAGEVERLSKLDRQASAHVESIVCMRTHFTGEPPYVGWLGIGLAINEVIDERDTLRAQLEAAQKLAQFECVARHEAYVEWDRLKVEVAALRKAQLDWSLARRILEQGMAIQQDYAAGKYSDYEELSAHLDEAARERVAALADKQEQP